jgi:hypothetical protein
MRGEIEREVEGGESEDERADKATQEGEESQEEER